MPPHPIPSRRRRSTTATPQPSSSTVLQTLSTGPHRIVTLCWSPSGHYLAAALQHGTILLFATQSSTTTPLRPIPVRVLKGHAADAVQLVFSSSNLLASASIDRSARLWQPATGLCLRRLPHADKVVAVAFDPADPAVLLTATANGQARLVRVVDRTILARTDARAQIHAAAMLPAQGEKSSAVLATRDGRLLQWRPQTAVDTPMHQLHELSFEPRRTSALGRRGDKPGGVPPSVSALSGGRLLLSSGSRRAVLAAGCAPRARVRAERAPSPGLPLGPGMSSDGRFSVIDGAGGCVRVLDGGAARPERGRGYGHGRETGGVVIEIGALRRATACCAAFAPDAAVQRTAARGAAGRSFVLAVGGSDGSIAIVQHVY